MSAPFNVLFICTHNSARSIMAEAILNKSAAGRFKAYSAGSQPSGKVHPLAIELLQRHRLDTSALRSKSWEGFAAPGAQHLVVHVPWGFRAEVRQKGGQLGLKGAATHERTEPVDGIRRTGLDPCPPGQTEPVDEAPHRPEQGIHGQGRRPFHSEHAARRAACSQAARVVRG